MIEDCCGAFFAVVVIAIVGIVVFMPRRAATLPPQHQEPTQGELQVLFRNVQLCERMVLPIRSTEKLGAPKTGSSSKHW